MSDAWIVVTEDKQVAALAAAARGVGGKVTALAAGARSLAEAAATAEVDRVKWVNVAAPTAIEAYAAGVAELAAAEVPRAVVCGDGAESRALAGAIAAKLGAAVVPSAMKLSAVEGKTIVECLQLAGKVVNVLETTRPVVAIYGGEDIAVKTVTTAPIEEASVRAADMRIVKTEPAAGAGAGVAKAAIVVSVGRGLKKKEDLSIIESLAKAMGAEIGCSMPVADDLGWVEKERYVGRSGQHIAPRLYLAMGIQGAPQHLEGVRDAKIVVGVNIDPEAPIFKAADYGIVGDLYEVAPALQEALGK